MPSAPAPSDYLILAGLALIVGGCAAVSLPAAAVVAGLGLIVLGVLKGMNE